MTVTNMAARQLITFAYQLGQFQLTGGPSWLADDKFDITAKMEGNPEWEGPAAAIRIRFSLRCASCSQNASS